MKGSHILVIDDEPEIRQVIQDILKDEGYSVSVAEDGERARVARKKQRPDLILLDIWMPDIDGISLMREWTTEGGLLAPIIMISGHANVETAVEATKLGAYDFLEKPLSLEKLLLVVKRALELDQLKKENVGLRQYTHPESGPVGLSETLKLLKEQVKRIAQHNAWVLITGEAGSGKEMFARYIHTCSQQASGPFVEVGVAAMAKENAAVELFGSEQGEKIHYGFLELANKGTLFLDEVADMDISIQAKLLSALENKSFLRVGGAEEVQFDVRVVAATHLSLENQVREGRFREDLYYQLNVLPIHIPPLREHNEDIPALLDYYVEVFAKTDNLPKRSFSDAARDRLRHYRWPGNVRELKNLVQRLLILGGDEPVTDIEAQRGLGKSLAPDDPVCEGFNFDLPLRNARGDFEKAYFEYHIRKTKGNLACVARNAGIERTHVYRKLKSFGMKPKQVSDP